METKTSTEIKAERQTRDEQNVLSALSDGLPHVFARGEHLTKTVRRMARQGILKIETLGNGDLIARKAVR
jgi:hypothetical protein